MQPQTAPRSALSKNINIYALAAPKLSTER